jgi:hypothetical protein
VEEIEKKERLLSKRKPQELFFANEDSIPTESQFDPVSHFSRSPEIADHEKEVSDSHSFDEQPSSCEE